MNVPCEVSGYCGRGLDHDGPCGPASEREDVPLHEQQMAAWAEVERWHAYAVNDPARERDELRVKVVDLRHEKEHVSMALAVERAKVARLEELLSDMDMKVAECVRDACGSADDYNADAADGLRMAIRKLDLAAVIKNWRKP